MDTLLVFKCTFNIICSLAGGAFGLLIFMGTKRAFASIVFGLFLGAIVGAVLLVRMGM